MEPITQEDIDKTLSIINEVDEAKQRNANSSSAKAPSKGNCKRLRSIKAKFITLTQEDIDNCFCSNEDRELFYDAFLIEWNKKDSVM